MATLIQNLQSIYTTKMQIKDVIGTQSDVFSEYPSLIEDALENAGGGITPSGYTSITTNGQYNVSSYAYAYVNVSGGGSGYYYPVHTVSDIATFEPENDYMWQVEAYELDGERGSGDYPGISTGVFTNRYWSYCYPNEFEVMENPVLDIDNLGLGFSMVSYTDLVKREFTYNALPDYNTYRGTTYSYQYANPHYNEEGYDGNTWDEYLTYSFEYNEHVLYSTNLAIVKLSSRQKSAVSDYFNGVYRVYDDMQQGLMGYHDQQEMGDWYPNQSWLSIGVLQPSETDGGPVTQFTSSYHGEASYLTGFDPYSLVGYNWSAVVDGRGWLVDLVSKGSTIATESISLIDGNLSEFVAYLKHDDTNHEFTYSVVLTENDYEYSGYYTNAYVGGRHNDLFIQELYGGQLFDNSASDPANLVPASGTVAGHAEWDNANLYVNMGEINEHYSSWTLELELHIPDTFYININDADNIYWTWSFSGTRNE